MDKSKFDDIIREKLESHVDPSGPSGTEMSRLFSAIPKTTTSAISNLTRVLIMVSSLMVFITIFLIYRNYYLEETMESLQMEVIRLGNSQSNASIVQDTFFWDSLESITKRVLVQNRNDSFTRSGIVSNLDGSLPQQLLQARPFKLSALDSQKFVNQIIGDLIATMENNPELLKELFSNIEFQENPALDSLFIDRTPDHDDELSSEDFRKSIVRELDEQGAIEKILQEIASDSVSSVVLGDIVFGSDPHSSADDQLNLNSATKDRRVDPGSLSEEKQQQVLDKYLAQNPTKLTEISKELKIDSTSILRLEEYTMMHSVERKNVDIDSLVLIRPNLLSNEAVREEQKKGRNKEWFIGGGLGFGIADLKEMDNAPVISVNSKIEYKPNKRIGLSSGIEFYSANGENYDVNNVDFSTFEDLPSNIQATAKEIKIYLKWLDLPIEAKIYFLPEKKIKPYVALSTRARVLIGEEYEIETNTDDIVPSFQSKNKFVFPTYGVGLGANVDLNPRVKSGIQISHFLGGGELGVFENQYKVINGQAYLLFRLN